MPDQGDGGSAGESEGEKVIVKTNMYDQEEIIYPCTVQILTNTTTGEVSVGWWRGTPDREEEQP